MGSLSFDDFPEFAKLCNEINSVFLRINSEDPGADLGARYIGFHCRRLSIPTFCNGNGERGRVYWLTAAAQLHRRSPAIAIAGHINFQRRMTPRHLIYLISRWKIVPPRRSFRLSHYYSPYRRVYVSPRLEKIQGLIGTIIYDLFSIFLHLFLLPRSYAHWQPRGKEGDGK